MTVSLRLGVKLGRAKLEEFAGMMTAMQAGIGFKVSARGWCYLLEQARYIDKDQFDKVENLVNRCRKEGLLPVDFVAEEDARAFSGVDEPDPRDMRETLRDFLKATLDGGRYYSPDWWDGEDAYCQMLVEKIDLKTLFGSVTRQYHVPVANAKGWSSILQRAEYARRFKEAEGRGLRCVLLYCGDHDPDGLRISDTIRRNLEQVAEVQWADGEEGYDPADLEIVRFGLNYDFIKRNGYTWIDNLITGAGLDLSSPTHPNNGLPYVQQYIKRIGVRKCEANAIVTTPDEARGLCRAAIEDQVGKGALGRFKKKREAVVKRYKGILSRSGLRKPIEKFLKETAK